LVDTEVVFEILGSLWKVRVVNLRCWFTRYRTDCFGIWFRRCKDKVF